MDFIPLSVFNLNFVVPSSFISLDNSNGDFIKKVVFSISATSCLFLQLGKQVGHA